MGHAQHRSSKQRCSGWGKGEARPPLLPTPHSRILWVPSSQPGHSISDPHTCFLPAWATGPQWLVSSRGQALSPFPLSDCPSVQRLRLQTSRSAAHGSLWLVHTRPATPQHCWQERLSEGPWESLSSKELSSKKCFAHTSPLSCFKTTFFFPTVAVEHESKHTYLIYQDVFYT